MPNRRRRLTATRALGSRRADYLATRIGRVLRESRLALGATQAGTAARAGVSQPFWSRLERGLTAAVSLATLATCAAAVDVQLAAFVEARPGADMPRDIEHVRRQELVVTIAAGGGWRARPERPIDPSAARSRSIDVLIERSRSRGVSELAVIEIEDLLADVGSSFRGLSDKVAAIAREVDQARTPGVTSIVAGLLVLRATQRNRGLVEQLGGVFRARFPASSVAWLRALESPGRSMPEQDGFVWSTVRGDRLFAARSTHDHVEPLTPSLR